MDAKLRIKMGEVEVEYEGSDDFLKKELPELLKGVLALHANAAERSGERIGDDTRTIEAATSKSMLGKLSASTAAAKLGVKSGSDMVLAAAAALVFGEGKESFSRAELLKAMQTAKAHFKATFRSNLSNYIITLIKSQDLLDHGGDSFGLQEDKRKELQRALA